MRLIFYYSTASGTASNKISMNLLNKVRSIYHKTLPDNVRKPQFSASAHTSSNKNSKLQSSHLIKLNTILRKNAHAFAYFMG
jgi:VanZ family protein